MAHYDAIGLEARVSHTHVIVESCTDEISDYLLRHEIMSVHGLEGSPQIYPACIQIKLGGSGTTVPEKTSKILNAYQDFDQTYMHYQPKTAAGLLSPEKPFFTPGPPVYDGSGGGQDGGVGYSGTAAANATLSDSNAVAASISSSLAAAGYTDTNYVPNPNAGASTIVQSGAISAASSLATTPVGTSIQAGATFVADPLAPLATAPQSVPAGPGASAVPSPPVGSGPAAGPSATGPTAGNPNAYAGPPPAAGADAANPAPSFNVNLSNKGVVNDTAAVDAVPDSSDGLEGANADGNTTASPSANAGVSSAPDPSATALAAGAESSAPSVTSEPATSAAATGTSEYASDIQGGSCQTETWRCQKKADGTMFLEVCEPKAKGYSQYFAFEHLILRLTM